MRIEDVAKAINPHAKFKYVGIRPGEKLHEQMIGVEDSLYTYEYTDYYKILPNIHGWDKDAMRINNGTKVVEGFSYTSDNNTEWMSIDCLQEWILSAKQKIG